MNYPTFTDSKNNSSNYVDNEFNKTASESSTF